jgi:hypothetical protein
METLSEILLCEKYDIDIAMEIFAHHPNNPDYINIFATFYMLHDDNINQDINTLQKLSTVFSGNSEYTDLYAKVCYNIGKLLNNGHSQKVKTIR